MIIRKCIINDALIIYKELGCNPEMLQYTGWNPYSTLESTEQFLVNAINSDEDYSWVIEDNGEVVGTIGAYDYLSEDGSIEIGYSIFQKYWGKGYATHAIDLVCSFFSSKEHIKCIKAWCAQENFASVKALERNGFKRTDDLAAALNVNGEKYTKVYYERYLE